MRKTTHEIVYAQATFPPLPMGSSYMITDITQDTAPGPAAFLPVKDRRSCEKMREIMGEHMRKSL